MHVLNVSFTDSVPAIYTMVIKGLPLENFFLTPTEYAASDMRLKHYAPAEVTLYWTVGQQSSLAG